MKIELERIRQALLSLKPSGADGFEGLLAVILSRITGQDFRLATSGWQNGKDGASLNVSFEGKRYDGKIDSKDILAKIAQLIASDAPQDVWILGATVEVGTQTSDMAVAAARKGGIEMLLPIGRMLRLAPHLRLHCLQLQRKLFIFFLNTVQLRQQFRQCRPRLS